MRSSAVAFRLSLAIALASFAFAANAQVVRTWVSTTAVDNPSCSRSSPCRTFGAAIAAVDAGGEVVVLDSGGYGAFSVDKSVTVIAPAGIHAAVAPTAGNAITVAIGEADVVRFVNLHLAAQGASYGVYSSAGTIVIDGCFIGRFAEIGVRSSSNTIVSDSVIADGGRGIVATGVTTVISNTRIERSATTGVTVYGGSALIKDTTVIGASLRGYLAVSDSLTFSELTLLRSTASNVNLGVHATSANTTVRLSEVALVDNTTGIEVSFATVYTLGNNMIHGNGTDVIGALTPIAAK